jgi:hypothetical protein
MGGALKRGGSEAGASDIMPGAEARSRRPANRTYKRLRDAQNFAQRLGVGQVDYGGRIDIANVANHAFFLAYERGVPMPTAVSEFVAEVFAGLLLGRDELRDNALVMEAFERFGGSRIIQWTEGRTR